MGTMDSSSATMKLNYRLVGNTDGNQRMTQMHEQLQTGEVWIANLIGGIRGDSTKNFKFGLNSEGLVGGTQLGRKKKSVTWCDYGGNQFSCRKIVTAKAL